MTPGTRVMAQWRVLSALAFASFHELAAAGLRPGVAAPPSSAGAAADGRIVFLMMVKPCFLAEPLWLEYIKGQPRDQFGFLLHHDRDPGDDMRGFASKEAQGTVAAGENVHHYAGSSGAAGRYSLGLAKQGLAMAVHALDKFPDAYCFVLVSDSHLPLVPFATLRDQLLRPRADGSGDIACINVPIIKRNASALNTAYPTPKWAPMKMCQWFFLTRKVLQVVAPSLNDAATWFHQHRWGVKGYRKMKAPDEWFTSEVISYIYSLPENQHLHVYDHDSDTDYTKSTTNPASMINYKAPHPLQPMTAFCACPGSAIVFDMDLACFVNFKDFRSCRSQKKAPRLRELARGTPLCPLTSSPYVIDHKPLGEGFNEGRPITFHPNVLTYLSRKEVYNNFKSCLSPDDSLVAGGNDLKPVWRLYQLYDGPVLFARKIRFSEWAPMENSTCRDRKAQFKAKFDASAWMQNNDLDPAHTKAIGAGRSELLKWGKLVAPYLYNNTYDSSLLNKFRDKNHHVTGALDSVDYAAALMQGEYQNRLVPKAEEIQAVVDAVNKQKTLTRSAAPGSVLG